MLGSAAPTPNGTNVGKYLKPTPVEELYSVSAKAAGHSSRSCGWPSLREGRSAEHAELSVQSPDVGFDCRPQQRECGSVLCSAANFQLTRRGALCDVAERYHHTRIVREDDQREERYSVTCRIIWRSLFELFGQSGADDEGFPGGFDDVGGDGVEVVDGHDAGDLAHESFDESEVAAGDPDDGDD